MPNIDKLHRTCEQCNNGVYEFIPMTSIICCNICGYNPNDGSTIRYTPDILTSAGISEKYKQDSSEVVYGYEHCKCD